MNRGQVAIRVLRELGVLFETPCPPEPLPPEAALQPGPQPLNHEFYRHTPLWQFEDPFYAYPYAEPGRKPVFETLDPETPLDEVLSATKLVVFLGAADTEIFRRCLDRPGVFLLIFEPDPERLGEFAAKVPAQLLARHAAIMHGDPLGFAPPISEVLPKKLFSLGFPVFYALPGFAGALAAAGLEPVQRFVEQVEILFFRHHVYPLSGQANQRNLPMRPLTQGLFYDQQLHAYENLTDYAIRPSIQPLRKAFAGETAVLVAAGPDLPARLELLSRLRESCVIIAVNNALKPLLAGGVRPHFVVANDTSVHTGRSFADLPRLEDVSLVAHCLTDLGGEVFARKFLFGRLRSEIFGTRPNLRLHGSVITTAFSLARHMGCTRCVLAGVQLCSEDPWSLAYSRGSIHERPPAQQRPLTNAFPQLVPVTNRFGLTRYTSLNFLDASLWFLEDIRKANIPCVNLTRESIIYGPGVEYDEAPTITPSGLLHKRLARAAALGRAPLHIAPALDSARRDQATWESLARGVGEIQALGPEAFPLAAAEALVRFDQTGVSYLVQRFEDFDNRRLHALVFASPSPADRVAGLRYFLDYVRRMAQTFADVLARQALSLERLAAQEPECTGPPRETAAPHERQTSVTAPPNDTSRRRQMYSPADLERHFRGMSTDELAQAFLTGAGVPGELAPFVPGLPPDAVQVATTSRSGAVNLQEAADFVAAVKACYAEAGRDISRASVLDFGCGWGRVTRFFLGAVPLENLSGVDARERAIAVAKELAPRMNFWRSEPQPPLRRFGAAELDLIVSYSVFSHLSEETAQGWITEFARILRPGGLACLTIRPRQHLVNLHKADQDAGGSYARMLGGGFDTAFAAYDAGKFVYIPTGGGEELSTDFFGEAIIPESYIKNAWTEHFNYLKWVDVSAFSRVADQPFIVLQKK